MNLPHRDHDVAVTEMFQRDPGQAAAYLNEVLENGDDTDMLLALRSLELAFGQQLKARQPGISLLQALRTLLNEMGLQLVVEAKK